MRHRVTDVGNFVLGENAEGKEFTDDHDGLLTLFASWVLIPC